jgi:hypothetical protein
MASMPAVTPVHEDVHEWACENEEEGQISKCVRKMLCPQQDAADDQEGRADEKRARRPETALLVGALMMLRVIVHGHAALLSFNH